MAKCEHLNFVTNSKVNRLTDENGEVKNFSVDIEIHCLDCMTPFEFLGLPNGINPNFATRSIEGTELRQPIKPITL